MIDEHINWLPHISNLSTTIARHVGVLNKLPKKYLTYILKSV